MPKFLDLVANHLFRKYQDDISGLTLVFPGKRAGLYFRRYLSEIIERPVFSPRIITMDELLQDISGMRQMDSFELIVEAYNIYKTIYAQPESFDDFYFWGEAIIRDFDEIDKYLVDAEKLFKNVEAIKNIDDVNEYLTENQIKAVQQFWGTFKNELSEQQQDFVKIWSVLNKIYNQLAKSLLIKEQGYQGFIYKKAVEKLSEGDALLSINNQHVFIGFNALNECEKRVLKVLQGEGKALFYWDYRREFIADEDHEAGRFIRENLKMFPQAEGFIREEVDKKGVKEIHLYNVASDTAQTSVAAGILKQSGEVDESDNSAIVLADESLLKLMLYAIPENINGLNVTMGFPFKQTQMFVSVKQLFELQQGKIAKEEKTLYYVPHVLSLLRSPYFFGIDDKEQVINAIIASNRTYIDIEEYVKSQDGFSMFKLTDTPLDFVKFLHDFANLLLAQLRSGHIENQNIKIELEFAFYLKSLLNRLENIVVQNEDIIASLKMLYRLFLKVSTNYQVSFIGEPLQGLQLMGLLETRTLDFNRLILLSANESVLPSASNPVSFIPYTLRKGFEMPVAEEQQSIYAYYFYRLISAAEHTHIIYQSVSDGLKTAEPSRYILQLKYLSDYKIIEHYPRSVVSVGRVKPMEIKKTEEYLKMLHAYTDVGDKAISPSGLNTYIDCSLKFYYRYIAGIKEPDEYSEEMDALEFGNVFHYAAELVYTPFTGKMVNEGDLRKIISDNNLLEKYVVEAFSKAYYGGEEIVKDDITGKNLIIFNIIKKYLYQLLINDIKFCPFEVVSLEQEYSNYLPISVGQKRMNVRISGKIDRIDKTQGKYRVIDYKTGKPKKSVKEFWEIFDASKATDRNSAVFQALLYCYLLPENMQRHVVPGLYFLRDFFKNDFTSGISVGKNNTINSYQEVEQEYIALLSEKVSELFNKDCNFEQTTAVKMCENCAYKGLCNRN